MLFESLIAATPRPLKGPLKVLDIGGLQAFWESMDFVDEESVEIVLVNLEQAETNRTNIEAIIGDARDLTAFADKEFDVVFSNSVIEHLNDFSDQEMVAREIKRLGKHFFVQTPNRYFPFEPHFLFPCFQFLPVVVKIFMIRHFRMGWYHGWRDGKPPGIDRAKAIAQEIRLLTKPELGRLFPDASIYREKFFGMTKSFIVYHGWETHEDGTLG